MVYNRTKTMELTQKTKNNHKIKTKNVSINFFALLCGKILHFAQYCDKL